ncbi:MAG TPA: hypothetical protein VGG20_15725, partial [Thermoanaerobaculia bacterium]
MIDSQQRVPFSRLAPAFALTFTVMLALFAVPARAAANPWTPVGPGGGVIESLAVDPGNPAVVYAIAVDTLYKSTDAGMTWTVLAGPNLQVVALDPAHPGTVYAGGQILLRSTDGGGTWTDVTPATGDTVSINVLAVAPDGVVFAADRNLLLRSADGGRTWPLVAEGHYNIQSVLVDPTDPRHIFYLGYKDISASDDGGLHWAPLTVPASPLDLTGLALAPSAPNRLYFLSQADNAVLRSDDRGASWSASGHPPRVSGVLSFQVDPRSPDKLYAASWEGIFTSGDGGGSWREITAGLPRPFGQRPQIFSFAVAPSRPATLYAGTDDGVGRSLDAGAHWRLGLETGLNAATPHLLKFHPLRPNIVYLALGAGDRSFRSTDGGRTWAGFARTISQQGLDDLAFDPVDPDLLYASNRTAIWRSTDGGESWTRISGEAPSRLAVLGHHTLLASHCGVLRSTDDGRTWKQVIPCANADGGFRTPISLAADPRDPRTVYVHFAILEETHNYFFEVFRSRDGGVTWTKIK